MTSDNDLEELKQGSSFGDRDDKSDPYREQRGGGESADGDDDPLNAVVARLEEIRSGDQTPSIGGRDPLIAAYLEYLKQNPDRMLAVAEEIENHLEHPPNVDHDEKAGIIKLLLRVGLQEAVPDEYELISESNAEYARQNP